MRRGGGQQSGWRAVPKEGVDLTETAGHGQGRVVANTPWVRPRCAPPGCHAGSSAHRAAPGPRMGRQSALHELAAVDARIVPDHHDLGCRRVGRQRLGANAVKVALTALRATWYGKRPVARPTAPKMLRRRLVSRDITCWREPLGDPGQADPEQQADVGLVFGQYHRTVGQPSELLVQDGQRLVVVRVALGDLAGSPPTRRPHRPAGAGCAARGRAAHGRPAGPTTPRAAARPAADAPAGGHRPCPP